MQAAIRDHGHRYLFVKHLTRLTDGFSDPAFDGLPHSAILAYSRTERK